MRHVLEEARIHEGIRAQVSDRNRELVEEVERATAEHDLVVVGMKTNPHPKRAVGALKMWTGWPTLPMVFVKGTLIGGADETLSLIESGELQRMLA